MATAKFYMDLSGRTLNGRYLLEARIGRGGFADVYRAVDTRVREFVAVKVLHPDHTRNITDVARFSNEAKLAVRIEDEGPEQYWICNYDSDEMCFLYYDPDSETRDEAIAEPGFHEKCWSVPPKYPCFYGTMSEAKSACELDCATERTNSQKDCTDFGDIVIAEMNGETHDTWECVNLESTMVEPIDISQCDSFLPAWEGAPAKTFAATVAIVGSDGGSTSQLGLKGYLTMRTENCTTNSITLDQTMLSSSEGGLSAEQITGSYVDGVLTLTIAYLSGGNLIVASIETTN